MEDKLTYSSKYVIQYCLIGYTHRINIIKTCNITTDSFGGYAQTSQSTDKREYIAISGIRKYGETAEEGAFKKTH